MNNTSEPTDFLIEIGTEELPANQLENLRDSFTNSLEKQLEIHGLSFGKTESFITPRRLAVLISELSIQQPPQHILRKGPAKTAAFDAEGQPTKAALGFAGSCGVPFEKLTFQETEQGTWLTFEQTKVGESTEKLLPTILAEAFKNLPLGRQMRWGDNDYSFLRPIHWIVLLLGNKTLEVELFGIKSSNVTYGHRFHAPNPIVISNPKAYEALLEKQGYVIPSFEKRCVKIRNEIRPSNNNYYHPDQALLNEVTGLVEWPVVLKGTFDSAFLDLPEEVLITSMKQHQKCFPTCNAEHKLLPDFFIVSNIESKNPKAVILGNENVMRARLSDALFFYEADKRTSFEQFRQGLKYVRFQQGLGTLWDKSERIAELAEIVAKKIGANPILARRAAELCKADLLTNMVGEFPELQGIMGYEYLKDKEPEVALAIKEHYWPKVFNSDSVLDRPLGGELISPIGKAIAIADRVDNLVGLFGIGKQPTGDKDPFALRRQALGAICILMMGQLDLDLMELLTESLRIYRSQTEILDKTHEILDFCFERSKAIYHDGTSVFEAVLALKPTNPGDFILRLSAVSKFRHSVECESLVASNKRVKNILSKSGNTASINNSVTISLLIEEAEKSLEKEISVIKQEIEPLLQQRKYEDVLRALSKLREPIDKFFNEVMVMAEDENLRNNRLSLLYRLRELFLTIADISLL